MPDIRMKIARIATVPFFLYNHLREQIIATMQDGHEVVLISSGGQEVEWLEKATGGRVHEIDIPRKISLWRDLKALWQLYRFFKSERFDIIHSTTPKAGMLCAIAGWLARTPVRLHTFTGQVWAEMKGVKRFIAKYGDWLTVHLNTQCYTDSASQRLFIINEGVGCPEHFRVLGAGSLAGVDLVRFDPAAWAERRDEIRQELQIPVGMKVVTFIGRMHRDKGLSELLQAYDEVVRQGVPCMLLLVGPQDADDGTLDHASVHDEHGANVRYLGYTPQPEKFLAVTDVFCLPSYREGFGNVIIEAAAMGVPSIGTDIVGLRDAIIANETGLLVPPKDVVALVRAMKGLLQDDRLRLYMGRQAKKRAHAEFDARNVNAAVIAEYRQFMQKGRD